MSNIAYNLVTGQESDTPLMGRLADLKPASYALGQLRSHQLDSKGFRRSGACRSTLKVGTGQTGDLTQTGWRTFGGLVLGQRRLRIMWCRCFPDQALLCYLPHFQKQEV